MQTPDSVRRKSDVHRFFEAVRGLTCHHSFADQVGRLAGSQKDPPNMADLSEGERPANKGRLFSGRTQLN